MSNFVNSFNLGTVLKQDFQDLKVSSDGSVVKRRGTVAVPGIDVGTVLDQVLDGREVPVAAAKVENGLILGEDLPDISFGSSVDQIFRCFFRLAILISVSELKTPRFRLTSNPDSRW